MQYADDCLHRRPVLESAQRWRRVAAPNRQRRPISAASCLTKCSFAAQTITKQVRGITSEWVASQFTKTAITDGRKRTRVPPPLQPVAPYRSRTCSSCRSFCCWWCCWCSFLAHWPGHPSTLMRLSLGCDPVCCCCCQTSPTRCTLHFKDALRSHYLLSGFLLLVPVCHCHFGRHYQVRPAPLAR